MITFCYCLAAGLTLFTKYLCYVKTGNALGKSIRTSSKEWFLEKTLDNLASWVGTIGFVWLIGYAYIHNINALLVWINPLLGKLPVVCPLAFLLGHVAEIAAPNALKWLVKLFTKE